MKKIILSLFLVLGVFLSKAQKGTNEKEYLVKYEVFTKKGVKIQIGFFDKDAKNAGTMVSEEWAYSFTTTDKNQNVQLFVLRAESGYKKVWVKVNIYVNEKLAKSVEDKFLGLGPTVQVNLNDIK
jgi:ribosomal protein S24E